jgi:YD repeat-containing protein
VGFRYRSNLHRLVDSTPNQNCILAERLGWHVPLVMSRLIREKQVEQDTNSSYNLSDSLTGNSSWTRKIEYNSSGLVTDGYDARGVHTTFSYDDLNRVTQITYSDSTPAAHYYYDSQGLPSGAPSSSSPDSYSRGYSTGRLVAMTYGSGATGNYFGYDNVGRVVQQFQLTGSGPAKYKLSYSYNYAGMLTSETYPSNRALAYAYDDGGRLASVGDGTTTFAGSFSYEAHGGVASETLGNAMVHALEYNKRLQANKVRVRKIGVRPAIFAILNCRN